MNNRILTTIILVVAVIAGARAVEAQLVIDDFKTGEYDRTFVNQTLAEYQTGAGIRGGTRWTAFGVQPLGDFNENSRLRIRRNGTKGYLILSAGFRSSWSFYLTYGVHPNGQANPLDLNLSGGKIRLTFDGADNDISDAVQITDRNGNRASLTKAIAAEGGGGNFHVDYPIDEFVGVPGAIDPQHIDSIFILLQAGTATGANDFALKSIKVVY